MLRPASHERTAPTRASAGPNGCRGSRRIAFFFLLPGYLSLGARILIFILFALSLDLILGYAGIVTLGHSAFFGLGAYTAGALGAHTGITDPFAAARRGRGALRAAGPRDRRGDPAHARADAAHADAGDHRDPARDRQQVDQHDRRRRRPGGREGRPDPRLVPLRHVRQDRLLLLPGDAVRRLVGRAPASSTRRSARCSPASARTPRACTRSARRCTGGWC